MELEGPQDLRARFRKFLFLTNERKKMSKSTLRKRIALTATTALFAGLLSVVSTPVASAAVLHSGTVGTTTANPLLTEATDTSTYVATTLNTGGQQVLASVGVGTALATIPVAARSVGLLAKDTSTGTAQTATARVGGVLSIYGLATSTTSFVTTGGTLSSATSTGAASVVYADPAAAVLFTNSSTSAATGIAALWTLPTTPGTYTFSKYFANGSATPNATTGLAQGTLGGQITVTVVATSAGGSYSAVLSTCYTKTTSATTTTGADSTTSLRDNGTEWYVGFSLKDAYSADLASGNLIATTSTGSVVNIGADNGAVAAGTASTVVLAASGSAHQVRIDQATAGVPVTATVTISYNGTTVCTKTVKIAGVASEVVVSKVATGDIGGTVVNANWLEDPAGVGTAGARSGHYYVQLKDSAGNIVKPASSAEFTMDPATTTTTVTGLAVLAAVATSTSSTSSYSQSVGTFACGPTAGSSDVKLRHTSAATGKTIVSPAFTARCADNPYTYTVSMDKAAYSQGEIGTMTVSFLDSKGNKANSVTTVGASTMILPMLTLVTATGAATAITDANGQIKYTFTVGTSTGMTAGTFSGIVDFTALTAVAAVKATPTYKLSTGGDTTTNADVLKSIVALIASINKQIQALQKLILKR
jgi:hypothetical protein